MHWVKAEDVTEIQLPGRQWRGISPQRQSGRCSIQQHAKAFAVEQLQQPRRGPTGRLLAQLPFAHHRGADVEQASENGLADLQL